MKLTTSDKLAADLKEQITALHKSMNVARSHLINLRIPPGSLPNESLLNQAFAFLNEVVQPSFSNWRIKTTWLGDRTQVVTAREDIASYLHRQGDWLKLVQRRSGGVNTIRSWGGRGCVARRRRQSEPSYIVMLELPYLVVRMVHVTMSMADENTILAEILQCKPYKEWVEWCNEHDVVIRRKWFDKRELGNFGGGTVPAFISVDIKTPQMGVMMKMRWADEI